MTRNYQIVMFLLTMVASLSCSVQTEDETNEAARIDPYDSPDVKKNEAESNGVESIKSEISQIELRDDRKANPEIDSLLNILEQAIAEKDVDLLLTTMDTNIISSYGGGMYGYEDFKYTWQDDYQELWDKLEKIISLGGYFENDSTYLVPFTGNVDEEVSKFDDLHVPYGCGISINSSTKLYFDSSCVETESINIGRTYCIVEPIRDFYGSVNDLWKVNVLGSDVRGYVKQEDFYCSADYSLVFEKSESGQWKIIAFAPWD